MFLNIAKYFKTERCSCDAVAFVFSIYLKPVPYSVQIVGLYSRPFKTLKLVMIISLIGAQGLWVNITTGFVDVRLMWTIWLSHWCTPQVERRADFRERILQVLQYWTSVNWKINRNRTATVLKCFAILRTLYKVWSPVIRRLLGVSPGSKLYTTFLNIAKHGKNIDNISIYRNRSATAPEPEISSI